MIIKKILLPTDFSTFAQKAVDYAISLFGTDGVEYTLLNLYHEPHAAATSMISLVDLAMQDSRNSLLEEVEHFKSKYGDSLLINYLSEYGEGGKQITVLAKRYHHDLVVMGSKGASGLKEVLIGSVAADTMKHALLPVIMVPEGDWAKPGNILVAIDDSTDAALVNKVRSLATQFNSRLTFLKVNVDEAVPEALAEDFLRPDFVAINENFTQVQAEDPVDGIIDFAKSNQIDMLVMFPGNHSFFERLFKRSNTSRVAMHSKIPMLSLHK